jgi:hypothetical protein
MLDFYCCVLCCKDERRVQVLGLILVRAGCCLIDLVEFSLPLG